MQQKHMSIIEQNLQRYNDGKIGKDVLVASIYEVLLTILPSSNIDKYELRQEVCTQLLSGNWQFANAEMLIHYVRAVAGNINKANFRGLCRQTELSDQYISDDYSRQYNVVQTSSYSENGVGHQPMVDYAPKKSIAELIKEKGDYRITELARLIGVSRQYIYKMIKTNHVTPEVYFKLKKLEPYNMLEAYRKLKMRIYNSFGNWQNDTFRKLGMSRAHFYRCKEVGVSYALFRKIMHTLIGK